MESLLVFHDLSEIRLTTCNFNYAKEGILHPDRILKEFDCLYLTEGSWDIWEGDHCYHVQKDHLLILEPWKRHYSIAPCTPGMRNMYIHFTLPSYRTASSPDDPQINDSCVVTGKLTDCSGNYQIRHLYEEIIELYLARKSSYQALRTQSLLKLLLCELSDTGNTRFQPADLVVEKIIHLFCTSMERFYSAEELSLLCGLSLRSLSTRFRRATGTSLHQYQLRLKLEMAYDLIPQSPGRSFRDIALSLGFYDEFQFSKLFKRQYGISPSARR